MTIKKITNHLEKIYPLSHAEKWDACGLIFGEGKKVVSRVLVALDLTTEVFNYALEKDVELIVVHHPFIFDKENLDAELELYEYKKAIIKRMENTGIGLYVMHTNFDTSPKGMKHATAYLFDNDVTSEKLDFGIVVEKKLNILRLKNMVKEKYGFDQFFTNAPDALKINKIAILPGTGGIKDMLKAKKMGVDIILTADIKWSTWITLKEEKIYALQISHQMEGVMINKVLNDIKKLKDIEVISYIERIIK